MTDNPFGVDAESVARESAAGLPWPDLPERCPVCHDVDLYTEEGPVGRLRCVNCGSNLSGADLCTPSVLLNSERAVHRIFPVLRWAWAPCQSCGNDEDSEEAYETVTAWCPDCRGPRTRHLVCDRFEGRDEIVKVRDFEAPLQLGNPCVWDVRGDIELVGMGPFHGLQVVGVWNSGHLDVVEQVGGRRFVGVPPRGVQPIS